MLRLLLVFFRSFIAIRDMNDRVKEESKEWDDQHPEAQNTPKTKRYMHQVIGAKVLVGSLLLGELDLSFLIDFMDTQEWFFILGLIFVLISSIGLIFVIIFKESEKNDNKEKIMLEENKVFHRNYKKRIIARRRYRERSTYIHSI